MERESPRSSGGPGTRSISSTGASATRTGSLTSKASSLPSDSPGPGRHPAGPDRRRAVPGPGYRVGFRRPGPAYGTVLVSLSQGQRPSAPGDDLRMRAMRIGFLGHVTGVGFVEGWGLYDSGVVNI
eukprot:754149-Hanusia_phi.AAC.5